MFEELEGALLAVDRDYRRMLDLQVPQRCPRLLILIFAPTERRLTVPKLLLLELETLGICRLMSIVKRE